LSEPYEVAYWSKKFKITPAKLKAAVKKVGHSAQEGRGLHQAAEAQGLPTGHGSRVSQPYEVSYWSKKFKVTPARLKAAVAAVGHSSKSRRRHLAKSKARRRQRRALKKTAGKTTKKRAKKKAA
jgi:hypothetical protein